jgi:hypothetical protein
VVQLETICSAQERFCAVAEGATLVVVVPAGVGDVVIVVVVVVAFATVAGTNIVSTERSATSEAVAPAILATVVFTLVCCFTLRDYGDGGINTEKDTPT